MADGQLIGSFEISERIERLDGAGRPWVTITISPTDHKFNQDLEVSDPDGPIKKLPIGTTLHLVAQPEEAKSC